LAGVLKPEGGQLMTTEESSGEPRRELPADLEETRRRFQQWRSSRPSKACPIPPELWAAAVDCATKHGTNRTALTLGLDAGKLRRKMTPLPKRRQKRAPAFVEFLPPSRTPASECVLELENPTGARLRIHLKGAVPPDLAELARSFTREGT
jgi:hypothetical protein